MKSNLEKYIRARKAILWCDTNDSKEIDDLLKESIKNIKNKEIYEFRALGVVDFFTKEISEDGKNLYQFIDSIFSEGFDTNIFLLIKDSKEQLEKPEVIAYLKKIAEIKFNNVDFNFTILIVNKELNIPKELEEFVSILEIENMNQDEIEKYILEFGNKNNVKIAEEDIGELAISLKGLTKLEINNILNMMIENKNTISSSDINIIIKEKGQIIKKSSILELIDFKEKMSDIGGLEGLKEWLESKAKIFRKLDEARAYGVDIPKGVLLVGMPGCGKSLAAKASARLFNTPLLRMDMGRIFGKYVGESEYNMRKALKLLESISPCILWIDEIEKAFSGIDQSGGASDITKRLFGQFLTWLQEKENTVFVVATANDISCFPPEFLRKGRFDEVFFVDFPNEEERERIFEIHLEKRGKNTKDIDIEKLAKSTEGYCGADIEEIVKITLERAFVNEIEEIDTQDLLDSVKEIDSLTEILKDKIEILKKGFEKFKIKSASKKLSIKVKSNVKDKKEGKVNKNLYLNKDMVFVQGGKYKPLYFDQEAKVVNLEVCKYQTTQDMWEEVMDYNNSETKGKKLPVTNITWWEALEYCNKLSEKHGLQPVYIIENTDGIKKLKIQQLDGEISYPDIADFSKTEGFRLPTQVEWEWFARGGEIAIQDGTFDMEYSGSNNYNEVAWLGTKYKVDGTTLFRGNSNNKLHPVGTLKPNKLGLYDCSGNVNEYCYDTNIEGYAYLREPFPYFFEEKRKNHSIKGGSYKDDTKLQFNKKNSANIYLGAFTGFLSNFQREPNNKISSSQYFKDTKSSTDIGFRIVRTVK